MNGSHLSEASLNDYAEGRLTNDELARTERHLAECMRCRSDADRLAALIARLHELPRELDPTVDLLPSIRAETRRRQAARSRRRALHEPRWPRVAAAALIVAAAALTVLTIRLAEQGGRADGASGPVAAGEDATPSALQADSTDDGPPLDELQRLETEYARATHEMLAAFREERERLGTGTLRVIENNIRTVERALRESREVLRTDPDSPFLYELVLTAHRQRLDVARRAVAVASGS